MKAQTIGQALNERGCNDLRALLERLGGDQAIIEEAVALKHAEYERDHCDACGTFIVRNAAGEPSPCVHCTQPRRPWPKSRQGYRR